MTSATDGRWVAWTLWTALCVGGFGSTVTSTDASGLDAIPSSDQGVVAVPAGAPLTVQGGVAPARGGPSISLLGGCGGVCLAQSRPTGESASSLVYSNRGADRLMIDAAGAGAYPADPATPVNVSVRVE